jgi:uncharacterized lipoprotein YddW (UPF0748 family)
MKIIVFLILSLLTQFITAQQVARETRAVWVSTNFALDWPPKTYNPNVQKESLKNIFKNLRNKHFNTIYFQVRSNGTVMYNSSLEPFSPYLTGVVGKIPSYDPLEYAIKLGKEYGIEVHAWLNMVRCFAGSNKDILLSPLHIKNIHPQWTKKKTYSNEKISYWLNPGLFEVQEYLTRILLEIANNYNVDGIHLDFFRYPDKNFDDETEYKQAGTSLSKDDWRRNNLTQILVDFKKRVNPQNPYLKIGITPIGIRKNLTGANGKEGYHAVYQDTEYWLKEALVDYLVPQIYWPFKDNPNFGILAQDWVNKSYGKNIVLGLGAYKPEIKFELNEMINFSREINAAGIAIFRYSNIADINNSYFNNIAFPKNMPWKYKESPFIKDTTNCLDWGISKSQNDEILISWQNEKSPSSNIRFIALNKILDKNNYTPRLLSPTHTKIKLKYSNPKYLAYQYQIENIDRLWNTVCSTKIFNIKVPYLQSLKISAQIKTKPIFIKIDNKNYIISIFSHNRQEIILETVSKEGLVNQTKSELKFGNNLINITQNFNLIRTLRIIYGDGKTTDEMNFY